MSNKSEAPEGYEPSPVGSRDRINRSIFAGVPVIVLLTVGAVLVVLLILNNRFMASVNECRAVQYPGATVVTEEQPYFLQPFGSLFTELHSPDDAATVEAWYNANYGAAMRAAVESGDFSTIAHLTWSVSPAEGGGSRIVLLCP